MPYAPGGATRIEEEEECVCMYLVRINDQFVILI
jgi:hypothetical protein